LEITENSAFGHFLQAATFSLGTQICAYVEYAHTASGFAGDSGLMFIVPVQSQLILFPSLDPLWVCIQDPVSS